MSSQNLITFHCVLTGWLLSLLLSLLSSIRTLSLPSQSSSSPMAADSFFAANDSGWTFWSKVYEDAKLRQDIAQRSAEHPSMARLLSSQTLCHFGVVFSNVPRIGTTQAHLVRQLISHHVRASLPIGDITISNRRWIVRLYKKEDAEEVAGKLDGFRMRGKPLFVRMSEDEEIGGNEDASEGEGGAPVPVNQPSLPEEPKPAPPLRSHSSERIATLQGIMNKDAVWSARDLAELADFKKELSSALSGLPGACCSLSALSSMGRLRWPGLVSAALSLWPLGLARLFPYDFRLIGRQISLIGKDDPTALHRLANDEGVPGVSREEWEEVAATNLRNMNQLISYASAFLSRFGPLHTKIDLAWRLLAAMLLPVFSVSPSSLALTLAEAHPAFLILDDVIYLANSIQHRRLLLAVLQPNQAPPL